MTAIRSQSQQGNKGALGFNDHHGKAIPLMQLKLFLTPKFTFASFAWAESSPGKSQMQGDGGISLLFFFYQSHEQKLANILHCSARQMSNFWYLPPRPRTLPSLFFSIYRLLFQPGSLKNLNTMSSLLGGSCQSINYTCLYKSLTAKLIVRPPPSLFFSIYRLLFRPGSIKISIRSPPPRRVFNGYINRAIW